jgi:hypothetical protein
LGREKETSEKEVEGKDKKKSKESVHFEPGSHPRTLPIVADRFSNKCIHQPSIFRIIPEAGETLLEGGIEMSTQKSKFSRRDMLKMSAGVIAGTILASCAPQATAVPPTAAQPAAATQVPTQAPAPPKATTGHVVMMHNIHEGEMTDDMRKQFEAK